MAVPTICSFFCAEMPQIPNDLNLIASPRAIPSSMACGKLEKKAEGETVKMEGYAGYEKGNLRNEADRTGTKT